MRAAPFTDHAVPPGSGRRGRVLSERCWRAMLTGREDGHRLNQPKPLAISDKNLGDLRCSEAYSGTPGKRHSYVLLAGHHEPRPERSPSPRAARRPRARRTSGIRLPRVVRSRPPKRQRLRIRISGFFVSPAEDKRRALEKLDVVAGCARRPAAKRNAVRRPRPRSTALARSTSSLVHAPWSPGRRRRRLRLDDRGHGSSRRGLAVRSAADDERGPGEDDQHPGPGHDAGTPSPRAARAGRGSGGSASFGRLRVPRACPEAQGVAREPTRPVLGRRAQARG